LPIPIPSRRTPSPDGSPPQALDSATGVRRLIRQPPDRRQPQVDRGRRVPALFEMDPVAEHDRAIDGRPRPGAVSADEFRHGVVVGVPSTRGRQPRQDDGLGVRQGQSIAATRGVSRGGSCSHRPPSAANRCSAAQLSCDSSRASNSSSLRMLLYTKHRCPLTSNLRSAASRANRTVGMPLPHA
jgi:hypothetical protein